LQAAKATPTIHNKSSFDFALFAKFASAAIGIWQTMMIPFDELFHGEGPKTILRENALARLGKSYPQKFSRFSSPASPKINYIQMVDAVHGLVYSIDCSLFLTPRNATIDSL